MFQGVIGHLPGKNCRLSAVPDGFKELTKSLCKNSADRCGPPLPQQSSARQKTKSASHQASRAKQRARSLILILILVLVFGLGMDMRKIGAPAQGQPASVDTDGTRLLLTGGKHDGVGCWMPPPPDAQGRPVGEKGRGDISWNMSWDTSSDIGWDAFGGSRRGSLGWSSASHGK